MNVSNYLEHSGYVLDDRPSRTLEKRRLEENEFFANINSKKTPDFFLIYCAVTVGQSLCVIIMNEFDCV